MCMPTLNVPNYLNRAQGLMIQFRFQTAAACVTLATTLGDANRNALPTADAASDRYMVLDGALKQILARKWSEPTSALDAVQQLMDQAIDEATKLRPVLAGTVARSVQIKLDELIAATGQLQTDVNLATTSVTAGLPTVSPFRFT